VDVLEPEFHRIDARCRGQFIDKRFDGKGRRRTLRVAQMRRSKGRGHVMEAGEHVSGGVEMRKSVRWGCAGPVCVLIYAGSVLDACQLACDVVAGRIRQVEYFAAGKRARCEPD